MIKQLKSQKIVSADDYYKALQNLTMANAYNLAKAVDKFDKDIKNGTGIFKSRK